MLQPKRTKFRKMHKGRIHGEAKGGSTLNFGSFGLKATQPERITARQIEAARRAMTRHMKRQGRVWIRIFPDLPVTSKPTEVRMGKGKGSVDFWSAKVKPGRVMFEIDGVSDVVAREALRLAAMKLPIKTRVVQREDLLKPCAWPSCLPPRPLLSALIVIHPRFVWGGVVWGNPNSSGTYGGLNTSGP